MASRRKARILAFQALYAWDASKTTKQELLNFSWIGEKSSARDDEELKAFASLLICGTLENIDAIDEAINAHLKNWVLERLKKVDLAILRVSVYSLLFQKDMPAQITMDEAIEIAKEYGSDESYRFINGILDSIWKEKKIQ